jgi:hypothetical protein
MVGRRYLSKTRYQIGLQCPKALWLTVHKPELADPISERLQAVFADGHRVGALARELFAGGALVAEGPGESSAALATTRRLLQESAPVIYEAAFTYDDVLIRADVLLRSGEMWDLIEVKSATESKPEHLTDAAIQVYVLQGAGMPVGRALIAHLDRSYSYDGGAYNLDRLFALVDVSEGVRAHLPEVPRRVSDLRALLGGECPEVRIGRHCRKPYDCAFRGFCHAFLPEFPITELPYLSGQGLNALLDDALLSILDVPLDHPALSERQREACAVAQSGELRVVGDLDGTLERLIHPIHFLDFETFKPALPVYPKTHPHQQLPFQWSDHVLGEDGQLEHREFLYEGDGDPRPDFVDSLLGAVDGSGSVVVYSSFENAMLNALARDFPQCAEAIAALQARLFDLEKEVVKQHLRHPDFHGSTSIKYVLPALIDDLSYEDLAIADGDTAMLRYEALASGRLREEERTRVLGDLRAYCATDTLAMVRLLQRFEEIGEGQRPA